MHIQSCRNFFLLASSRLVPTSFLIAELLVIDNGSTDDTKQVVEGFRRPGRTSTESRPGLSSARNAGVAASTGDLIVFTDDDVVVDPGWSAALTDTI